MFWNEFLGVLSLIVENSWSEDEWSKNRGRRVLDLTAVENFEDFLGYPKTSGRIPHRSGILEGRVRILGGAATYGDLEHGEIAVLPATNSSFNAYLPRCGAIVADAGGALCHAAICAREAHIPAVCGCAHATAVLKTGDTVRVDGTAGTVDIVARRERLGP